METVKILPNGTALNVMGGAACKDIDYSENIEIVIKMPRYAYDDLMRNKDRFGGSKIYDVIFDGVVLEEHGRLIDGDEEYSRIKRWYDGQKEYVPENVRNYIQFVLDGLKGSYTVLEASKAEEDG